MGGSGGVIAPDVGRVLELLNDLAQQGVLTGGGGERDHVLAPDEKRCISHTMKRRSGSCLGSGAQGWSFRVDEQLPAWAVQQQGAWGGLV